MNRWNCSGLILCFWCLRYSSVIANLIFPKPGIIHCLSYTAVLGNFLPFESVGFPTPDQNAPAAIRQTEETFPRNPAQERPRSPGCPEETAASPRFHCARIAAISLAYFSVTQLSNP